MAFEELVHQLNANEKGLLGALEVCHDLYHPIDHPCSEDWSYFMIQQKGIERNLVFFQILQNFWDIALE